MPMSYPTRVISFCQEPTDIIWTNAHLNIDLI